jgi:hypothetical protein
VNSESWTVSSGFSDWPAVWAKATGPKLSSDAMSARDLWYEVFMGLQA